MLKGCNLIFRENNCGIYAIKQPLIINKAAEMAALTFMKSCPFVSGIPMNFEDVFSITRECAKISMQEDLLLSTVDMDNEKVLALSISLSLKGKARQQDLFKNWKWVDPQGVNIMLDLFSKVEVPIDSYPNPVYGFSLAVTPDLVKNKIGTQLYSEGLKYWKSLGYKSRFTEATSRRSQSIVIKNGGELIKSYRYDDYFKDSGYKLGEISKGESLAHLRTLF